MTELARARSALERGEHAAALAALVRAWWPTRAPRVADLVDLVDERLGAGRARPPSGGPRREEHAAWLALAAEGRPEDLRRLLATLASGTLAQAVERLEALAGRTDPRLAHELVGLLAAPPFTSSSSSGFWERAIAVLERLADVRQMERVIDLAVRYPEHVGAQFRYPLPSRLLALASRAKWAQRRELDPAEAAECATMERRLAAAEPPSPPVAPPAGERRGAGAADDLVAAIYQRPDDDQPRMVYADWLSERGDPRGELIVLQMAEARGEAGEAHQRRQAELLAAHAETWAGPLADVASQLDYRRGFPASCALWKNRSALRRLVGHPAWATIETLRFLFWSAQRGVVLDDLVALLAHPAMRSLRAVEHIDPRAFLLVATRREVGWHRVSFTHDPDGAGLHELMALLETGGGCRRLGFHIPRDGAPDALLGRLLASPLLARLDQLDTAGNLDLGPWLTRFSASALARWEHAFTGVVWRFQRDASRALGVVEVACRQTGDFVFATVLRQLARLDRQALTEIRFATSEPADDQAMALTPYQRGVLRDALAGFPRLERVEGL
jgi:uncharacterized protein (TIGR02996 family)